MYAQGTDQEAKENNLAARSEDRRRGPRPSHLFWTCRNPRPRQGKTLVVATTHGNQPTDVTVNGKPVIVGVNAYIRNR